jgi:hypothetical protein
MGSLLISVLVAMVEGELCGQPAASCTDILAEIDQAEQSERVANGSPEDPWVLLHREDALQVLMGRWSDADEWLPGLAQLSAREARFLELDLNGWTATQIAFSEGRHRAGLTVPLDPSTVHNTLAHARAKVRRLLAPYYDPARTSVAEIE